MIFIFTDSMYVKPKIKQGFNNKILIIHTIIKFSFYIYIYINDDKMLFLFLIKLESKTTNDNTIP